MLKTLLATLLFVATALASAAPAELAPSHFNDASPVDASALGTRLPVVLVHGLGGSAEGWESFLRAYEQNPAWRAVFKPYSFRYATTTAEVNADPAAPRTLSGLGAAFRDTLQGFYDKPATAPDFGFANKRMIVLAHSMGGLVARSMMQEHTFRDGQRGGDKVIRLITLGTPHHGTQMADAALMLGLTTVRELSDIYAGFLGDMAWTNFDGLDMASGRCNPWLAQLNNYASSTGANHGRCGAVPANPLPGYYERIIAYGAGGLQLPDIPLGIGVFEPGSELALSVSYGYLYRGLSRSYPNDGIVPLVSAQFVGPALWHRGEAFACDHRYIKRGYTELVRSLVGTYRDVAFCAAIDRAPGYASGMSGGYAVSGSILGVAGGIVDTIRVASETERVFDWAEQAYARFLLTTSGIVLGANYRYYPASQAYLALLGTDVYYLGPESGQQFLRLATLADFLELARSAGY
jgi:pimeloyl-ACP methyl ester carboxylesterase